MPSLMKKISNHNIKISKKESELQEYYPDDQEVIEDERPLILEGILVLWMADRHYMFFQTNSLLRRLSFEQFIFESLKASTTLIRFGKRSRIKLEAVLFQN